MLSCMSTVQEIETAIRDLPVPDQWDLAKRLRERLGEAWDRQIAADAAAGRLDHLVVEVEADIKAGRTKPLNEVLDNA